mgnify:FL=1|tara:strand:+ start:879 stop:1064 length:186 start_codon:yes stop_codon:yes gene_type:complete
MKLNKELLMKVLSEHNWGIYLKSKPLEEMSTTNLGIMYHINEVEVDNLIEEYNANLEIPEE